MTGQEEWTLIMKVLQLFNFFMNVTIKVKCSECNDISNEENVVTNDFGAILKLL